MTLDILTDAGQGIRQPFDADPDEVVVYDDLNVSELEDYLESHAFSRDTLTYIRQYEKNNENRKTALEAIDEEYDRSVPPEGFMVEPFQNYVAPGHYVEDLTGTVTLPNTAAVRQALDHETDGGARARIVRRVYAEGSIEEAVAETQGSDEGEEIAESEAESSTNVVEDFDDSDSFEAEPVDEDDDLGGDLSDGGFDADEPSADDTDEDETNE